MSANDNERPADAEQVPRGEFDGLARAGGFSVGPFISSFGDGPGEPYVPHKNRNAWGTLLSGRSVWAGAREEQKR